MQQDLRFRVDVRLHRAMSIQVVGRDVEHGCIGRTATHQLQLKAAQLHDDSMFRLYLVEHVEQHITDVAADPSRVASLFDDAAHKRGRRRLACAACDADDRRGTALEKQLSVIGQADAALVRRLHGWQCQRHPTADAQDVDVVQEVFRLAAEHEFDTGEFVGVEAELSCGLVVADPHARADFGKPARQRPPLSRKTEHSHPFPGQGIAGHRISCFCVLTVTLS